MIEVVALSAISGLAALGWLRSSVDRRRWQAREREAREDGGPEVRSMAGDRVAKQPIIDWNASLRNSRGGETRALASDCPRCGRAWWVVESCCECDVTDAPHFHRTCSADCGRGPNSINGCGAVWILRSKDAPPLVMSDPHQESAS